MYRHTETCIYKYIHRYKYTQNRDVSFLSKTRQCSVFTNFRKRNLLGVPYWSCTWEVVWGAGVLGFQGCIFQSLFPSIPKKQSPNYFIIYFCNFHSVWRTFSLRHPYSHNSIMCKLGKLQAQPTIVPKAIWIF